jgi:hypothetical protein
MTMDGSGERWGSASRSMPIDTEMGRLLGFDRPRDRACLDVWEKNSTNGSAEKSRRGAEDLAKVAMMRSVRTVVRARP